MTRFGIENGIRECYIDCIPPLVPYYKAIGFTIAGQRFFHQENGTSYPMKLDIVKHVDTLCREYNAASQLRLYLKAQAIKVIESMRIRGALIARRQGEIQ